MCQVHSHEQRVFGRLKAFLLNEWLVVTFEADRTRKMTIDGETEPLRRNVWIKPNKEKRTIDDDIKPLGRNVRISPNEKEDD